MKTNFTNVARIGATLCVLNLGACGGGGSADPQACGLSHPKVEGVLGCPVPLTSSVAPASISFVSALPQNIAIKGTGGTGRQESSTVVFKVYDVNGNPVAGTTIDFSLTTNTGGLTLNPASGITGTDGTTRATILSGFVNTPVRVMATVREGGMSAISDQLVVSTGIPDQKSFTVSPKIYNIECGDHNGTEFTTVTALVADHFNNPVPDGIAVSFTTESGAIDASCLTGLVQTNLTDGTKIQQKGIPGQCTVRFICQNPRPNNGDGRSTVLAYAVGEETFADDPGIKDGINRYDLGEVFQDLGEPFRYDRAVTNSEAMNANLTNGGLASPATGEPFIDSNGNGRWNSSGDSSYNGILQSQPNGKTPVVHVRQSFVLVFSGSNAVVTPLSAVPLQLEHCVNGTPFTNLAKTFHFAVRDDNPTIFAGNSLPGNILPAGTTIEFSTSLGKIVGGDSFVVPNTSEPSSAIWTYPVSIQSTVQQGGPSETTGNVTTPAYVCDQAVTAGLLTAKVTTPLKIVTTWSFPVIN